jgi:hypothetical protein
MKDNKRLKILLIILVILIIIAVIVNVLLPEESYTFNFLKGTEWVYEEDGKTYTLSLTENGSFLYLDNKILTPVPGYEECNTYELNNQNIELNCDKKIKIITSSEEKLYLKLDGKTKILNKKELNSYKTFKVGYLDNVNTPVLLTTYEDFIKYIDTFKNTYYDGDGNAVSSSTDAIRNQYDQDYFNENNLAIYYAPTNSGSVKIKSIRTVIKDNTLEVIYELMMPEVGTMDMSGFMITIETDKSINNVK